ncbi:hypothetical protein RF679_06525 [Undibacterium cyanobacteriorum]|uniref:Uncharacterized protein n=1 Tax=Undibacterium cyanobacteriorum TaxID=3073561 RepID=A0ABY9RL37_9BURK|nr:hypothetical protein [Undibacterium sp. 20NA77.5]WMW81935.1 hypothetical protein RF679_06525 [Undibacterium sp. 20NA77.5]
MQKNALMACYLIFLSFDAFACQPNVEELSLKLYLKKDNVGSVIFAGQVMTVTERREGGVIVQTVKIKTSRWWRGEVQSELMVMGKKGAGAGTSCAGVDDIVFTKGQEWLIVGELKDGKVIPRRWLSRPLFEQEAKTKSLEQLSPY